MPSQSDINAFGNALSVEIGVAEATAPPPPSTEGLDPDQALALLTAAMSNIIRPHIMKRGFATAFGASLDPPWIDVAAPNASGSDIIKFGPGWLNAEAGWAPAAYRKVPLLGKAELRGKVMTAGSNALILTLPPLLLPAKNELFTAVIDYQPAQINVWVDGTVSVWYAEATTRQHVSLSGISYETLY